MSLRGGITVFASDLDASRLFYAEALRMALSEDEDGFWARRDGLELRVEGGARPRQRSRTFFEEAGVMVRIETDEFDSLVGALTARGIRLLGGGVKEYDDGRFTGFADPDGNLFELIETPNGAS
jgi:catechol 2,3-dioxygenase-like lactoylglutathione lyase family enzyme